MSESSEERLQDEIEELRGELGETLEALVHKVDLPTRAKERGNELKAEAIERGGELKAEVVERGGELRDQVVTRGNELKDQAAEWARETVSRTPRDRWAKLAGAGLALITLIVIVRRVWTR